MDSWSSFLALLKILERYGCVVAGPHDKYTVTMKGDLVASVNWDNPLLATSLLGLTWDLSSKADEKNAEKIRDAVARMVVGDAAAFASLVVAEDSGGGEERARS